MIQHLYLHIPFCHRICPYCSFYKHTPGGTDMAAFVECLLLELAMLQQRLEIKPRTIFLGGGTPTALSETHLAGLLGGLRTKLDCSELEELCLEANPKTVNHSKARLLRELGVTRVSLGLQAWDEPTLKLLGRDHAPDEAEETFETLRAAEIPSLNLDLMFSIPGQSLAVWERGLDKSLSLQPDHISCYNLTYEEDTDFLRQLQRGQLDADEHRDADHFHAAIDKLTRSGFEHYEISNYASSGHRSKHNQAYWRGADYLGLGPSATSTVERVRWKNIPDTTGYLSLIKEGRMAAVESEELSERQWLMERIALELRTSEGVANDRLVASVAPQLEILLTEGLVVESDTHIHLTRTGKALADQVAEMLIADE